MRRLSPEIVDTLPDDIARPGYDRGGLKTGVLHFGPGAFFRVHQAWVFDRLCETDPRWGVCAVSLKSPGVREALTPQDGLYTLAELGAEIRLRVIGALREVLVGPEDPRGVFEKFESEDLRLVTLTITEKGYCLGPDRTLDFTHPDVAADLASPERPVSAIGWLTEGLRRRRAAGLAPPVVISCDNLPDNGALLKAAVLAMAARRDAGLADWIDAEVAFPSTMVDSITPATDAALRARVEDRLAVRDAWPVQREPFVQWVIERHPDASPPDWESVGVDLTADVRDWERTKLRLLNGAHSTLAYAGLIRGRATVAEAMADAPLAGFVERMMREDIAPTLRGGPEPAGYIAAVLERFRNPGIVHALSQIAWDGSQKLPIRLLGTLQDVIAAGGSIERLCIPVAAWMRFVTERVRAGNELVDPLAETLVTLVAEGDRNDEDLEARTARFLSLDAVFPRIISANGAVRRSLAAAWRRFDDPGGAGLD